VEYLRTAAAARRNEWMGGRKEGNENELRTFEWLVEIYCFVISATIQKRMRREKNEFFIQHYCRLPLATWLK
jgi:hypothetical protein